jgi:hypothetical protein
MMAAVAKIVTKKRAMANMYVGFVEDGSCEGECDVVRGLRIVFQESGCTSDRLREGRANWSRKTDWSWSKEWDIKRVVGLGRRGEARFLIY